MRDRCKLCHLRREDGSDYCVFHLKALVNLEEAYEAWKEATDIEWREFFKQASERPETGSWARDVAVYLLDEKSCS